MFKFLSTLLGLAFLASGANAAGNESYLVVTLWDSFGDGWEDAWWILRDPGGAITEDQSTCDPIEKIDYVYPDEHPPSDGFYFMTVNTHDESIPEGWWEIYWRVDVYWGNGTWTGQYYEGVYNTTMVWEYDEDTDRWHLVHYEGLPDFTCTGCTGGKCKTKPKPRSKAVSKKGKGPLKGKGSKGSTGSDSEETGSGTAASNATAGSGGSNGNATEVIKYGPRAVDLQIDMFSEECNGWTQITPIGANWYISDWTLTELFDHGSLCSGCHGVCNICLGDGSYVFRVTGPTFNETLERQWFNELNITEHPNTDHSVLDQFTFNSWQFCHATGSYNEQLNFHVKKGKCIPDNQLWADEICDKLETSSVTLLGVVALGGMSSERFTQSDSSIVLSALAKTVSGWSVNGMSFLGSSIDTRSLSSVQRALNSFTHDIEFTVTFVAEDYGVSGETYGLVENLVEDMADTLQAAFDSGAFTSTLVGSATLAGATLLTEVTSEELISLEISSIGYSRNHLVYIYDEDNSVVSSSSSSSNSYSGNVLIAAIAVAGVVVVAFVGVMTTRISSGYKKLSAESDHQSETTSQVVEDIEIVENPFANTEHFNNKRIVFPSRRV